MITSSVHLYSTVTTSSVQLYCRAGVTSSSSTMEAATGNGGELDTVTQDSTDSIINLDNNNERWEDILTSSSGSFLVINVITKQLTGVV